MTQRVDSAGVGRGVAGLVLMLCVGFLGIIAWGAYSAVDQLSAEATKRAASQTEAELNRFFAPVEANLNAALGWARAGELDPREVDRMTRRFIPLLRPMPQVTSMLVATPEGVEYMLLDDGDGWRTRSTDILARPGETHWVDWNDAGVEGSASTKKIDYDPRERPWFKNAMTAESGVLSWTEPYTFFTTKDPGITVSSRVPTPRGELIVAFDLKLLDISKFTTTLDVSERGMAFVLADNARVLGLPGKSGFDDVDARKELVLADARQLGIDAVVDAIEAWDQKSEMRLEFKSGGEPWLGALRQRQLGKQRLWIGVAMPESDFRGPVSDQRWALALLALLGVLAALGLGVFYSRRHSEQLEEAVEEARTQLGQYSLEEQIGQGGMGDVYKASHVLMRREVAIKLVRADKASEEYLQRFEREVQLTSMLNHPNTIQIYDFGSTSDGTFYYAMELLNGVSLAKFIDIAGAIDAGRCIFLLRQMCESLREAHRAGLVHRDVKPGNVHVCERGGLYDVIKVLDFGLVKDVKSVDDETELTGDIAFGTPGFVAPEAIRDSRKATAVSDIYAIGAIAYALLTARPMFNEVNKVKLLLRQLGEDPEKPSSHRAQPLPSDLEGLVMTMIQRDPDARPRSMDDVLDQLDACADANAWTAREARRWWANRQKYFRTRPKPQIEAPRPAGSETIAVDLETRIH